MSVTLLLCPRVDVVYLTVIRVETNQWCENDQLVTSRDVCLPLTRISGTRIFWRVDYITLLKIDNNVKNSDYCLLIILLGLKSTRQCFVALYPPCHLCVTSHTRDLNQRGFNLSSENVYSFIHHTFQSSLKIFVTWNLGMVTGQHRQLFLFFIQKTIVMSMLPCLIYCDDGCQIFLHVICYNSLRFLVLVRACNIKCYSSVFGTDCFHWICLGLRI